MTMKATKSVLIDSATTFVPRRRPIDACLKGSFQFHSFLKSCVPDILIYCGKFFKSIIVWSSTRARLYVFFFFAICSHASFGNPLIVIVRTSRNPSNQEIISSSSPLRSWTNCFCFEDQSRLVMLLGLLHSVQNSLRCVCSQTVIVFTVRPPWCVGVFLSILKYSRFYTFVKGIIKLFLRVLEGGQFLG